MVHIIIERIRGLGSRFCFSLWKLNNYKKVYASRFIVSCNKLIIAWFEIEINHAQNRYCKMFSGWMFLLTVTC